MNAAAGYLIGEHDFKKLLQYSYADGDHGSDDHRSFGKKKGQPDHDPGDRYRISL